MPAPMSQKLSMADKQTLSMGAEALTSGKVTPEEVQAAAGTLSSDPSWLQSYLAQNKDKKDPYTFKPSPGKGDPQAKGSKKDAKEIKEDKKSSTMSKFADADSMMQMTDVVRNLPEFKSQQDSIDEQEKLLSLEMGQPTSDSSYWVKPLSALADSMNPGSKVSMGMPNIESQGQKNQRFMQATNELGKRKADLSKSILEGVAKTKTGTETTAQNQMLMQQLATMTGLAAGKGAGKSGVGETAVDRMFAKKYIDFITEEFPALQQNIATMGDLVDILNTEKNLTGPYIGSIPKSVRDVTNPASSDLQERYEKIVGESLKRVLGGQFTDQEGTRVLRQSFNPTLDQATNAKRIRATQLELQQAAEAKAAAARYYEQNGFSLKGYQGSTRVTIAGKTYDLGGQFGMGSSAGSPPPPKAPGTPTAKRTKSLDQMTDAELDAYEAQLKKGG